MAEQNRIPPNVKGVGIKRVKLCFTAVLPFNI